MLVQSLVLFYCFLFNKDPACECRSEKQDTNRAFCAFWDKTKKTNSMRDTVRVWIWVLYFQVLIKLARGGRHGTGHLDTAGGDRDSWAEMGKNHDLSAISSWSSKHESEL